MPGDAPSPFAIISGFLALIGEKIKVGLDQTGGAWKLLSTASAWIFKALFNSKIRLGRLAIISQIVRVGVRSVFIISLVSFCVGFILAFQMAPTLSDFGQVELVPNIVVVAVFRELGPLIAAIVMTGFAGAAITAELGTMVVGEEIEALEAHALNPVRFLVVPRLIAVVVSMTCVAVIANIVAVGAGMLMGTTVLGIPSSIYLDNTITQSDNVDFITGLVKAAVFGLLIAVIACLNGLRVTGGAAGVGNATTSTVVQSIVAIIIADLAFTGVFYALGLN
ncbi:MAG: ABC transporter permease [Planctomycetota bacterium]|nr:ABC transporter permease [Planctomycetota bacterium]